MASEDYGPNRLPFIDGVDASTALEHHLCRKAMILSDQAKKAGTEEEREGLLERLAIVEKDISEIRRERDAHEGA